MKRNRHHDEFKFPAGLIKKAKSIRADEFNIYIKKAQNGDREAQDLLIVRNENLVHYVALKYSQIRHEGHNLYLEYEDIAYYGMCGLVKAIQKFDFSKKTQLSTYAIPWISSEIRAALRIRCQVAKLDFETVQIDFTSSSLLESDDGLSSDIFPELSVDETGTVVNRIYLDELLRAEKSKPTKKILQYYLQGRTIPEIAKLYGCSQPNVRQVINAWVDKHKEVGKNDRKISMDNTWI